MAQGMYAHVGLAGSNNLQVKKIIFTVEAVTLTVYDNVSLINISERGLTNGWLAYTSRKSLMATPITKDRFEQDFTDLMNAVGKVDKVTMLFPCGSKVVTYCVGKPVVEDETKFLEMSWEREAWWMNNPFIAPIVESIREYYPTFSPWKGTKEVLISAMLSRSSLL